ncbi:primosomal protein N' [Thermoactinospora rubra]|uniref:primosomal protein N' n=1 Tax=Thermoactinospora rubra TaxID=1088767 RepID=UPI000A0F4285|nr:primosomal protein N' [Thermoactinospora rubra]
MPETDDALLPLEAVGAAAKPAKGAPVPAPSRPVARVAVDTPLPHLDRPFDYLVPESLHEAAQPGVRVRVRFAGKLVDGFLLDRADDTGHEGRLVPLERVISPEPVLTPEIAGLARAVADRYAGTLADVLRLAIPPRHARVEAESATVGEDGGKGKDKAGGEVGGGESSRSSGEDGDEGRDKDNGGDGREGRDKGRDGDRGKSGGEGSSEDNSEDSGGDRDGNSSKDNGEGRGGESGESSGEGAESPSPGAESPPPSAAHWADYPMSASFLDALRRGRAPRAVWGALPGRGWAEPIAEAVGATLAGGRGAVVVVPDGKDVALADQAFAEILGPGRHVALTAGLGPAERYRRWLKVLRGEVRAVVGTRAAMFAPVRDLGLAVIWDDGDDLHAERLAPYPHAREVLALRAHRAGAAMLIGGYARTAEATQLIATGWARPLLAARQTVRAVAPLVRPAGEDAELAKDEAARAARLPSLAWRALKEGLEHGPVLIQVPRRGYVPVIACRHCRAPARCSQPPTRVPYLQQAGEPPLQQGLPYGQEGPGCHGPLALRAGHAAPYCRWCGRVDAAWRCPRCGGAGLRAVVIGARRTAEELGRAFPSVPVKTSGRDGVLATVGPQRALVVATPGAEPVPEGGYAAAVLLDGWALLGRADLRAAEETVRRWMNAAALLRPRAELVVLADAALPAVQALVRWDPVTHAERELAERAELGFPPAVRMATLTGAAAAVRQMLEEVRLPRDAQVLGPVPVDDAGRERAMIRVPRQEGPALAAALKAAGGVRAARKAPEVVRVSVDPLDLV